MGDLDPQWNAPATTNSTSGSNCLRSRLLKHCSLPWAISSQDYLRDLGPQDIRHGPFGRYRFVLSGRPAVFQEDSRTWDFVMPIASNTPEEIDPRHTGGPEPTPCLPRVPSIRARSEFLRTVSAVSRRPLRASTPTRSPVAEGNLKARTQNAFPLPYGPAPWWVRPVHGPA